MKYPKLKHIPVEEKKSLPNKPGVYIFINSSGVPIYIGTSKNLKQRVSSHDKREGARYIAYFPCICSDKERLELEKSLINHYKPALNTTYKYIFLNDFTWV